MIPRIGLQLYSVREDIAKRGFESVVRLVAELGYSGVETGGLYGSSPQAAGKLFKEVGLAVCSIHHDLPGPAQKAGALDLLEALDCTCLIDGGGPEDYKSVETIQRIAERFNQAASLLNPHGVRVGVHNHWWEFLKVKGDPQQRYAYEILLESLVPEITFQLDTYWIKTAGVDPAVIVKAMGKRAPLLHIKDGPAVQHQPMTAVGEGVLDFPSIARAGLGSTEWMIVELDACATDMIDAVRNSCQYLTGKGLASGRK